MTTATYPRGRRYACPDGHVGQHGNQLRTIVPDGLDLAPACTACQQPMTPDGGPLRGTWRVDDCCTPSGPGGTWAGPPRDPAACTRCFGTRQAVICTTCLLPGCSGDHGDTCLACDGSGRVDCPACDGEGHVYNEFSEDQGLCPDSRCVAGRAPCDACGGIGRKALPGALKHLVRLGGDRPCWRPPGSRVIGSLTPAGQLSGSSGVGHRVSGRRGSWFSPARTHPW